MKAEKAWWNAARDAKGAALYAVMHKASNEPDRPWLSLNLVERDNWCSYAEEYEALSGARPGEGQ